MPPISTTSSFGRLRGTIVRRSRVKGHFEVQVTEEVKDQGQQTTVPTILNFGHIAAIDIAESRKVVLTQAGLASRVLDCAPDVAGGAYDEVGRTHFDVPAYVTLLSHTVALHASDNIVTIVLDLQV
jgi:hypothetical protein